MISGSSTLMYLTKIEHVLKFYQDPEDVLETYYNPETSDYKERSRLLRVAKGQIKQSEKDLNRVFELISELPKFISDINHVRDTSFNQISVISLMKNYGAIAWIFRELQKTNTRLQKNEAYVNVYGEFIELCKENMFDLMIEDLDSLLAMTSIRNAEFNLMNLEYRQELTLDKEIYIESYKQEFKTV